MTILEAVEARHMVRKYKDISLSEAVIKNLKERVEMNNSHYNLNIKLMVDNKKGVNGIAKHVLSKGVKNYFILAGDEAPDLDERLGYCSADLMLYAQTLGLNTWYVGGMFNRSVSQYVEGRKVIGVIAVGYGQTEGIPHKSKSAAEVSMYDGEIPEWFVSGIKTALLAPTALNKQDFIISGKDNKVKIENENGLFTGVNRGLVKYHFELGAGKNNFEWV